MREPARVVPEPNLQNSGARPSVSKTQHKTFWILLLDTQKPHLRKFLILFPGGQEHTGGILHQGTSLLIRVLDQGSRTVSWVVK